MQLVTKCYSQPWKWILWNDLENSDGQRPLSRPRSRWEDNNRMDLREIVRESVDWLHLAQDRDQWLAVVNTVMNL